MNIQSPVLSERFWSKVHVTRRNCCWLWLGPKDSFGYGKIRVDGGTVRAHRVAFWLRNGVWPENGCHRCDNPSCCNPDHIFDGTHADNMKDMVTKGRHRTNRGENHYAATLTDDDVKQMRSEYLTGLFSMEALASRFGCGFSTVQRVISRKSWRHI